MSGSLVLRSAKVSVPLHLAATLASLSDDDGVVSAGVGLNLVLFVVGVAVFVVAFVIAAARSRDEAVWFGGAFLLNGGVVDPSPRRLLRAVLACQIVIGLAGAGARPFTPAAFSVLTPLLGFGLMALFGSRFGRFPSRPTER